MRRIKQKDNTGCGLACIAMLAETNYEKIKQLALEQLDFFDSSNLYTNTSDLQILANNFEITLSKKRIPFKNRESLPPLSILAINYREDNELWHWVVYKRTDNEEYIYDPKKSIKSNKRTDFGKFEIRWYVRVTNT